MFCENASYQTEKDIQNCGNLCGTSNHQHQIQSFEYIPTEQSERNPSNIFKQNLSRKTYSPKNHQHVKFSDPIRVEETMNLVQENTRRDYKRLQAVQRNKNISAILSIILAFTQRCETLKQKLCGYPAESFSPVDFFNVLDITEKGFVDIYDVKRFVNNEKIRQKDIIALFKRVNGDHSKDNTKLTYFGYLNLVKPYFNEQLARDLLLRDTLSKKDKFSKANGNLGSKITGQTLEVTQQSVLILFQELMLLHCICTTEHQQAKQLLMNDYILNSMEIKKILGLDTIDPQSNKSRIVPTKQSPSRVRHKTALSVIFEFIENNSQFEIQFTEMKFLLAFLNCHEFSLTHEKYISHLFLPTNCKAQLVKEMNKRKQEVSNIEDAQNYMNTYLTRENLLNKGDVQIIRNYLDQRGPTNTLSANHLRTLGSTLGGASKPNFLQFVHPRSIQRVTEHQKDPHLNNAPSPQQLTSPQLGSEHPQFQVNVSNKYLSNNISRVYNSLGSGKERVASNPSSIPQENIRVILPKQNYSRQDYEPSQRKNQYRGNSNQVSDNTSIYGHRMQRQIKNDFYQIERSRQDNVNLSKISNSSRTPFLERFMKKDNILGDYQKDSYGPADYRKQIIHEEKSRMESSGFNESAFQVVDYGYQDSKMKRSKSRNQASRLENQSPKLKKSNLSSRYDMVVSQYKGQTVEPNHSSGPNFLKLKNRNNPGFQNPILQSSKGNLKGNLIDSVGLSQSKVVNQSNVLNKFSNTSAGSNNILNQFLKKA